MAGDNTVKNIARWSGFVSGVLTFILGLVHVCNANAYIKWPEGGFTDDVNAVRWRAPLFSLEPNAFVDHWTPVVFGAFAWASHFETFNCTLINGSFLRYFLFHFVMGMFATIGYRGGLGIIFSILPWFTCLMCIWAFVIGDDSADLNIKTSWWKR